MGNPSDKEFKTYEEMIDILKNRNIVCDSEDNAIYILKNNPYYTLVNGYKDIFIKKKISPNEVDDFQGTNFNDLKYVYDFDRQLSAILYKYLNNIEESFKSVLSYSVSKEYGYEDQKYLDSDNYKIGIVNSEGLTDRDELMKFLLNCKNTTYYKTIIHYRLTYSNVPPWILTQKLTFGKIINWYKLSSSKVQKEVNTHFLLSENLNNDEKVELFLNSIYIAHEYRNIVAHGDRVLQCQSNKKIKISLLRKYLNNSYTHTMARKQVGSKRLPGIIMAISILLSNRNTVRNKFVSDIQYIFNELNTDKPALYTRVLRANHITQHYINTFPSYIKAPSN